MLMSMLVDQSYKPILNGMVSDYLAELWQEVGEPGVYDSEGRPLYTLLDDYFKDLDHRYPFIFFIDGEMAGFSLVYHFDDHPFEVAEFYLYPKYRGRGFGRAALDKMKAFCMSIEKDPMLRVRCFKRHPYGNEVWKALDFQCVEEDRTHFIYDYKVKLV